MTDPVSHNWFDEEFLRRLERLSVISKQRVTGRSAGMQRSHRLGDGLEFADHRAYAPGDDVRFIDWCYYARMEKLLLRMFHEHSEAPVVVLMDASGSMVTGGSPEKFDYARGLAAALGYIAMSGLRPLVVRSFSDRINPEMRTVRNRDQFFRVLEFLGGLVAGGRTDLPGCVRTLLPALDRGACVLILSDLFECERDLSETLTALRVRECDVGVLHVYSPGEVDPRMRGAYLLEQVETGERMSVHVDEDILTDYRTRWEEFCARCERAVLSGGANYVGICTDLPFEKLVLEVLRRGGVLTG